MAKAKKTVVDRKGVERCRRCGQPAFNCRCHARDKNIIKTRGRK